MNADFAPTVCAQLLTAITFNVHNPPEWFSLLSEKKRALYTDILVRPLPPPLQAFFQINNSKPECAMIIGRACEGLACLWLARLSSEAPTTECDFIQLTSLIRDMVDCHLWQEAAANTRGASVLTHPSSASAIRPLSALQAAGHASGSVPKFIPLGRPLSSDMCMQELLSMSPVSVVWPKPDSQESHLVSCIWTLALARGIASQYDQQLLSQAIQAWLDMCDKHNMSAELSSILQHWNCTQAGTSTCLSAICMLLQCPLHSTHKARQATISRRTGLALVLPVTALFCEQIDAHITHLCSLGLASLRRISPFEDPILLCIGYTSLVFDAVCVLLHLLHEAHFPSPLFLWESPPQQAPPIMQAVWEYSGNIELPWAYRLHSVQQLLHLLGVECHMEGQSFNNCYYLTPPLLLKQPISVGEQKQPLGCLQLHGPATPLALAFLYLATIRDTLCEQASVLLRTDLWAENFEVGGKCGYASMANEALVCHAELAQRDVDPITLPMSVVSKHIIRPARTP